MEMFEFTVYYFVLMFPPCFDFAQHDYIYMYYVIMDVIPSGAEGVETTQKKVK